MDFKHSSIKCLTISLWCLHSILLHIICYAILAIKCLRVNFDFALCDMLPLVLSSARNLIISTNNFSVKLNKLHKAMKISVIYPYFHLYTDYFILTWIFNFFCCTSIGVHLEARFYYQFLVFTCRIFYVGY